MKLCQGSYSITFHFWQKGVLQGLILDNFCIGRVFYHEKIDFV